jgi:antitoxin ParD1/3/4
MLTSQFFVSVSECRHARTIASVRWPESGLGADRGSAGGVDRDCEPRRRRDRRPSGFREQPSRLANFAIDDILTRRGGVSAVPTRNISLTPEQDAFVEKVVQAGEYQNASEALRDALRVLQQRRREDALKLKALRAQLQAGVDALERGEFVQIDESDVNAYVSRFGAARSRRRR